MNFIQKSTKRLLFTVLFLCAVFTTFRSISGVQADELADWVDQQKTGDELLVDKFLETLSVTLRWLPSTYQPETQISAVEVKRPKTLEESIDFTKYKSVQVLATGYTAGKESTGKTEAHPAYGITKSGLKVKRDLYSTIAADTDVFPIGTVLFIPGYGYGVVADTGSKIKGKRIDLYFNTVEDVYEKWGKKQLDVYVIKRGDGDITEAELKLWNEDESMQVFRQQLLY